jgi:L-alanine-DL-glutamate epimerase-like enolase superfamily enzyme
MRPNRRHFLSTVSAAGASSLLSLTFGAGPDADPLEQAASKPILNLSGVKDPVVIDSIELLRKGDEHFLRVRSKDGAEGIAVDNGRARIVHPILNHLVAPYFLGKDARELEEHLFGVYREGDNYKYQGLALWCPVALVEFAILDMLGRIANRSIAELLGGVVRTSVPFYVASGRRDTTPDEEIDYLKSLVDQTGARAIKYRVGGRMSRNADASPNRTEKLIPLTRKAFGDEMAIHADANSSYDAAHAIPVGRMLEDIGAVYFEEPCPFDDFEDTKKVTDALTIPIALGEQESSHARFRDQIRRRVADIVQPDLFYYGGLIRSIRIARMAAVQNMP